MGTVYTSLGCSLLLFGYIQLLMRAFGSGMRLNDRKYHSLLVGNTYRLNQSEHYSSTSLQQRPPWGQKKAAIVVRWPL